MLADDDEDYYDYDYDETCDADDIECNMRQLEELRNRENVLLAENARLESRGRRLQSRASKLRARADFVERRE